MDKSKLNHRRQERIARLREFCDGRKPGETTLEEIQRFLGRSCQTALIRIKEAGVSYQRVYRSVYRSNREDDRRFKFRVTFSKGIVEIPLTRGEVAIVDIPDSEKVLRFRWYTHKESGRRSLYAWTQTRGKGRRKLKLHRLILEPPPGLKVDHVDGDGLNNRRSNLRPATRQQNRRNARGLTGASSRFKGVTWEKRRGKWSAGIKYNGKPRFLGYFRAEEEAAAAYDAAAAKAYGEFAWLNGS